MSVKLINPLYFHSQSVTNWFNKGCENAVKMPRYLLFDVCSARLGISNLYLTLCIDILRSGQKYAVSANFYFEMYFVLTIYFRCYQSVDDAKSSMAPNPTSHFCRGPYLLCSCFVAFLWIFYFKHYPVSLFITTFHFYETISVKWWW